jgi:bleomycin hydrolase
MKNLVAKTVFVLILISVLSAQDEKRSKSVFIEPQNQFWENIEEENEKFITPESEPVKVFHMDLSGLDLPNSTDQFTKFWHQPPLSQGNTGACWCFAATSFFESEIYRLTKRKIKLSEMYTVYWEFVEKARRFVQKRGDSNFDHGSMGNAVVRIWKKYGIVPINAYNGRQYGQKFHDHSQMFSEMLGYLGSISENNIWNEADVLGNIKSILNYYMGEPPLKVIVKGMEMTPLEYFENIVRLNLDNYIDILSLKEQDYYQKVVHPVMDNWWLNSDYYNVRLDDFMLIINRALTKGYTIALGGDTSEPGYDDDYEVALVPTFDIPSAYIDEDARQFRFSNRSTTDDHGIHAVGFMKKGDEYWYLIKDSGSGAQNGPNKGYFFYHQDYVKLKMLDMMVHKDMVSDVLTKFPAE